MKGEMDDIDLQLFDVIKMFDKLWIQEAINDLYEVNMTNDNLSLLYKENQNNSIAIKSPYGISNRFIIEDVIMQGTVFAPLQATTSMSQLGSLAYKRGKPLLTYKETVQIPAMGMIDDIATVTKCGMQTVLSNAVTNSFVESKRLQLGPKKSHRLHFGKKHKDCLDLKIHGDKMENSNQEKYVGDIITEDAKNDENIAARKGKAFAIAGDILAILDEIPLGPYRIDAGLCMRNGMFLNAILTNSEVWYGLKSTHITELEEVDEYLLRQILNAHSKTPKEMLHLETGTIPVEYVYH